MHGATHASVTSIHTCPPACLSACLPACPPDAVMYGSIFAPPGHGIAAPLAAGLALFAITSTGE